jgi:hypothetical protein
MSDRFLAKHELLSGLAIMSVSMLMQKHDDGSCRRCGCNADNQEDIHSLSPIEKPVTIEVTLFSSKEFPIDKRNHLTSRFFAKGFRGDHICEDA